MARPIYSPWRPPTACPPTISSPLNSPNKRTVFTAFEVVIGIVPPAYVRGPFLYLHRDELAELQRSSAGGGVHNHGIALYKLAGNQLQCQRILNQPLDRPAHRTGSELGIVTLGDQHVLGRGGDLQPQLAVLHQPSQRSDLDLDDFSQVLARQRVEHDDVVDAIQNLRPE